jgi:hypothetical protein
MPRQSTRSSTNRPSGNERVFADHAGRLWSAADAASAVIFTCISDARQSGRALAVDPAALEEEIGDETLRAWLRAAPKIATLS